jgi:hypothetical protein
MIGTIITICSGFFIGYRVQLNLSNFSAMALGQSPDPNMRVGLVSSIFCLGYMLLGGHAALWTLSALVPIALIAIHSYMLYGRMPNITISVSKFISGMNIPVISQISAIIWSAVCYQDSKMQSWAKQESNYPKIRDAINWVLTNLHWIAYAGITMATIIFCLKYALIDLGIEVIAALTSIVLYEINTHQGLFSKHTREGLQKLSLVSTSISSPISAAFILPLQDSLPYLQALFIKIWMTLFYITLPFARKAQSAGKRTLKKDYKPKSCDTFTDDLNNIHTIQQDLNADFTLEEIKQTQVQSKKTLRSIIDNYFKNSQDTFIKSLYRYYPIILLGLLSHFPLPGLISILSFCIAELIFNYWQKTHGLKEIKSKVSEDPTLILKGQSQHIYDQLKESEIDLSTDQVKNKLRFSFNPEKIKQAPEVMLKFPEINDQLSDAALRQAIDQKILPYLDTNSAVYLGNKQDLSQLKDKIDDLKHKIDTGYLSSRGIQNIADTVRSIAHILNTYHEAQDIKSLNGKFEDFLESFNVCAAGIQFNVFNFAQQLPEANTPLDRMKAVWDTYLQSFWTRHAQPHDENSATMSTPMCYWKSFIQLRAAESDQQDLHAANLFNLMWTKNLPSSLYATAKNETMSAAAKDAFNLFNAISVPSIEHLFGNEWQTPMIESGMAGQIITQYLEDKLLKQTSIKLSDFKTMLSILPQYAIDSLADHFSDPGTLTALAQQAMIELRNTATKINADSVTKHIQAALPGITFSTDKQALEEAIIELSIADLNASKQAVDTDCVHQYLQRKFGQFFDDEHEFCLDNIQLSLDCPSDLKTSLCGIMKQMIERFDCLGSPHTAAITHILMQAGYIVRSKDIAKEQKFSGLHSILSILLDIPKTLLDLPKIIKLVTTFIFKFSIDVICLPVSSAKLAYRYAKPTAFSNATTAKENGIANIPAAQAA